MLPAIPAADLHPTRARGGASSRATVYIGVPQAVNWWRGCRRPGVRHKIPAVHAELLC